MTIEFVDSPTLTAPGARATYKAGADLARTIEALTVTDATSFRAAGTYAVQIKAFLKRVSEFTAPMLTAARANLKAAQEQDATLRAPAVEAEKILKGKLTAYETAERLRAAAERAQAYAQQQSLQDAAQLEADLEADLASEAAGTEVAARPAALVFARPTAVEAPPQAEGVSFREIWDFEVIDFGALPDDYKLPDAVKLRAVAQALKSLTKIPGVRAFSRRIAVVRADGAGHSAPPAAASETTTRDPGAPTAGQGRDGEGGQAGAAAASTADAAGATAPATPTPPAVTVEALEPPSSRWWPARRE